MPNRQTYQINKWEQNKAAQRDQSYRNCLVALLIFFFICLILILACVPWKTRSQKEYKDGYIETQYYNAENTSETTTSTIVIPLKIPTMIPSTTTRITTTESTPTKRIIDVITVDHSRNVKGSRTFERYFENKTTTKSEAVMPTAIVSERGSKEHITTIEKILQHIVVHNTTTEKNISSTTLQPNVTDNILGNNATLPDVPIMLKYNVTIVDIINRITTSNPTEEITINKYSSDTASTLSIRSIDLEETAGNFTYNTSEADIVTDTTSSTLSVQSTVIEENIAHFNNTYESLSTDSVTDNIMSSTSSTLSINLEENANRISTGEYEILESDIAIDNIMSSTIPNLSIDITETSHAKYSSDEYYFEISRSDDPTSNTVITMSSILPVLETHTVDDIENSTGRYLDRKESTILKYNAISRNNEHVTIETSPATEKNVLHLDTKSSAITENESKDAQKTQSEITKKYNENIIFVPTEKYNISSTDSTSTFYTSTTAATMIDANDEMTTLATVVKTPPDEDISDVCETGRCKQIASKMLSYMNHSADPCEDFYEYACGGFEADPQVIDGNLVRRYRNYQRIARQMLKEKRKNIHSTFVMYYDSCIEYEKTMAFSKRIKMANDALGKIGEFYTTATWPDNYAGFTDLFARLILHHSALLFDIVPELDEYRPNNFTLKIGPSTYTSLFRTKHLEDPCSEDEFETKEQYVNLEVLYDNYKRCKNNTKEFMRSIKEALTEFGVFKDLNNGHLKKYIESEYIDRTIDIIDSIIIKGYFEYFPSKNEILEAYLMNNYSKISLEELQSSSIFVNWTQLIYLLSGVNVVTSEALQIYFHTALVKGLRKLEKFGRENPMDLNNAIMGLYAHKLYHELVVPRRDDAKDHCLQMSIYLLRLEASSLYISSFSDQEIAQMNRKTENIFNELKRTLKLKTEKALWAKKEGRQRLLTKIDDLELALPVVSYFRSRDLLYNEYNVSEVVLNNNYFNNSMILLRRYRILMYAELRRQVGDSKQIWTYYATPFQWKAKAIYGLNLIVIPYGVIDWSSINDEHSFDFLLLATLGNLIAHQIAHHFDANGIHYWDKTRNTQNSLMYENEFTDTNFDDYINCHKENLYQEPMNMTLPFTNQIVSFTIPQLTLNERLSEIMGLRLAYDTLALMRSNAEERLPWTRLRIDQLFYLAYAQMYCTKSPLTSSYVSLYENEELPSRIRVFVSASNNKLLAEAWNCPVGSQIAPNDICSVFPYIDFKETALNPV